MKTKLLFYLLVKRLIYCSQLFWG